MRLAVEACLVGDEVEAVLGYIWNDEEAPLEDGLGTDRDLHGCLSEAKPNLRFEPLPAVLNQVDGRDGRAADLSGKLHQAIEGGLGSGVEHMIAAQGGEPVAFLFPRSSKTALHSEPVDSPLPRS